MVTMHIKWLLGLLAMMVISFVHAAVTEDKIDTFDIELVLKNKNHPLAIGRGY